MQHPTTSTICYIAGSKAAGASTANLVNAGPTYMGVPNVIYKPANMVLSAPIQLASLVPLGANVSTSAAIPIQVIKLSSGGLTTTVSTASGSPGFQTAVPTQTSGSEATRPDPPKPKAPISSYGSNFVPIRPLPPKENVSRPLSLKIGPLQILRPTCVGVSSETDAGRRRRPGLAMNNLIGRDSSGQDSTILIGRESNRPMIAPRPTPAEAAEISSHFAQPISGGAVVGLDSLRYCETLHLTRIGNAVASCPVTSSMVDFSQSAAVNQAPPQDSVVPFGISTPAAELTTADVGSVLPFAPEHQQNIMMVSVSQSSSSCSQAEQPMFDLDFDSPSIADDTIPMAGATGLDPISRINSPSVDRLPERFPDPNPHSSCPTVELNSTSEFLNDSSATSTADESSLSDSDPASACLGPTDWTTDPHHPDTASRDPLEIADVFMGPPENQASNSLGSILASNSGVTNDGHNSTCFDSYISLDGLQPTLGQLPESSRQATEREATVCKVCDQKLSRKSTMRDHMRMHTGQKIFQCAICGRVFTQHTHVRKHLLTHKVWPHEVELQQLGKDIPLVVKTEPAQQVPESLNVKCPYCAFIAKNKLELRSHLPQHKDKKVYQCVQKRCGITFQTLELFLTHLQTHAGELFYPCPTCLAEFRSLDEVSRHQAQHAMDQQPPNFKGTRIRCSDCSLYFRSYKTLGNHLLSSNHRFVCPACPGKVYSRLQELRRHIKLNHKEATPVTCQQCQKTFDSRKKLNSHMRTHDPNRRRLFTCAHCSAQFQRFFDLSRHIRCKHQTKNPLYTCPVCNRNFARSDRLKEHIQRHGQARPFVCDLCGAKFKEKQCLKVHLNIHAPRKFHCEPCGLSFARTFSLRRHMKLHHPADT